ncbi:MAG: SPFH/Band 7/PHB domain protein, partial [Acidimicrobiia bacterium]|nr:SPFH/Band 7/PHB domain protein [Acidimicrobiia bacterium]
GEARATERVFQAIHAGDPTPDLIANKYLEALAQIADGKASKVFIPLESARILGSMGAVAELFGQGDSPNGQAQ